MRSSRDYTESGGLLPVLGLIAASAALYRMILRAQPDFTPSTPEPPPRPNRLYYKSTSKVLVMRADAGSR